MNAVSLLGRWRLYCRVLLVGLCCAVLLALSASTGSTPLVSAAVSSQEAEALRHYDRGIYVHYCPANEEAASMASYRSRAARRAHVAMASHAGWPADDCLKMDKGSYGLSHTLVGLKNVHNWLLGGYGNDTVYGGDAGDVIWGDYQPSGQSESERDYLHAGNGNDWIYSSHGFNEIWTGGGDDHLLLVYGHGVIHCNGPGVKTFVMRYLPANRPWTLIGCAHKVLDRYRA
jgi:RTX calcium-binding nonapeptide repeat (4 copies)